MKQSNDSVHSAVEMLHDSALYKFMIDIDIVTRAEEESCCCASDAIKS